MADLIKRDSALKGYDTVLSILDSAVNAVSEAKAIVLQYGSEPEQRWVPVSERLPEEHQICIVTDETRRNTYEYRFCKETYDEEQGWTYLKNRIIAWMPMPDCYEGGEG